MSKEYILYAFVMVLMLHCHLQATDGPIYSVELPVYGGEDSRTLGYIEVGYLSTSISGELDIQLRRGTVLDGPVRMGFDPFCILQKWEVRNDGTRVRAGRYAIKPTPPYIFYEQQTMLALNAEMRVLIYDYLMAAEPSYVASYVGSLAPLGLDDTSSFREYFVGDQ